MFKHVLVPLDGSRLSARALPYAAEVAGCFGAHVTLLRVEEPSTPVSVMAPGEGVDPRTAELLLESADAENRRKRGMAQRYLNNHVRALSKRGVDADKLTVVARAPAKVILDVCRKQHVDLVVMSTHGRSGLNRTVLGSVSDTLVRERGVPVLVVRPK